MSAQQDKHEKPKEAPRYVTMEGRKVPLADPDGVQLIQHPWKDRSYKLWAISRERKGLKRTNLEMYLDACGYCTTCKGRGQISEFARPVFGVDTGPNVRYLPCPAKCRKGRVRNAWEPWYDPETGEIVQPSRYTPQARKNIGDEEPTLPPDNELD